MSLYMLELQEKNDPVQNQMTKIIDPIKNGRPPFKRKSSKVNQFVNKLARKRLKKEIRSVIIFKVKKR